MELDASNLANLQTNDYSFDPSRVIPRGKASELYRQTFGFPHTSPEAGERRKFVDPTTCGGRERERAQPLRPRGSCSSLFLPFFANNRIDLLPITTPPATPLSPYLPPLDLSTPKLLRRVKSLSSFKRAQHSGRLRSLASLEVSRSPEPEEGEE